MNWQQILDVIIFETNGILYCYDKKYEPLYELPNIIKPPNSKYRVYKYCVNELKFDGFIQVSTGRVFLASSIDDVLLIVLRNNPKYEDDETIVTFNEKKYMVKQYQYAAGWDFEKQIYYILQNRFKIKSHDIKKINENTPKSLNLEDLYKNIINT